MEAELMRLSRMLDDLDEIEELIEKKIEKMLDQCDTYEQQYALTKVKEAVSRSYSERQGIPNPEDLVA